MVVEGRAPRTRRGERIPPQPDAARRRRARVNLDRAKIAEILVETREVAVLLADAMNLNDDEASVEGHPPRPTPVADVPTPAEVAVHPAAVSEPRPAEPAGPNLPGRYARFYMELIASPRWSAEDADRLARKHGLLLGAAVEEINDWAFGALGGPVIFEETGRVEIDVELINEARGGT